MKKYTLFLLAALSGLNVFAQTPACCKKPVAGGGMQALALTEAFIAAHEPPLPFQYKSDRGSMIQFETLDGKKANAYFVPGPEATNKVLIIFHEWWGLNDYIKREAVRIQDSLGQVDVYAVDLYDGQVATTSEQASTIMGSLDNRRTANIMKGILAKVGRDKMIATLGWCMGGSYAFTTSVLAGQQASGCVMYYGFPEKEESKIKPLQTDVLYIWASQDKFITRDLVMKLQEQVVGTGHKFTLMPFDADHAFANPSNPKFNAAAAALAQTMTFQFLKKYLALD